MTRQEALEYLNLPISSSDSLVRKRYLELQVDYQKAISNAPSEHFRTLYRENLDKIEEAYLLMKEFAPDTFPPTTSGSKETDPAKQNIKEAQHLVDSFLSSNELKVENLDQMSQTQILNYIDQISSLQDFLRDDRGAPSPGIGASGNGTPPLALEPELAAVPVASTVIPEMVEEIPESEQVPKSEEVPEPEEDLVPLEATPTNGTDDSNLENIPDTPSEVPEIENLTPQEVPATNGTHESQKSKPIEEESAQSGVQPPELKVESKIAAKTRSKTSKSTPPQEGMESSGKSLSEYLFNDSSGAERRSSFNRLLLATIFVVFLSVIGGGFYIIYPILYPEEIKESTEQEDISEVSIPQIVGDEFFRTGNYLEALVQYTLAVADDAENPYLLQQIDSCKSFLAKTPLLKEDEQVPEEATPALSIVDQPKVNNSQERISNSSNLFRGEDPVESKPFIWAEDDQLKEQVVNSARSAQLEQVDNSEDSITLTNPKSSGGAPTKETSNRVKNFVDVKPEPIGGWEAFAKFTNRRIRYPSAAYKAKVSGLVLVQFVVNKDGSISELKVVKGIGHGCDEEALRLLRQFKGWNPGELNGEIVNTRAVIPINFKLSE